MMSINLDAPEAILQRQKFFTSESVDNFLKKNGIPKTRIALRSLAALEGGKAGEEAVEILGHVYYQIHAQQINIRDKANGKMIVSIRR
ncbi:MAG: hypothetical protein ACREAN_08465 [Nitrosopumilaceae archaeon]